MATPGIFDAFEIKGMTLRSRVLRSSLGGRLAYYDGTPTPAWRNFERRFARAENRLQLEVAPGAHLLGWDIAALGLPQAGQPFARGSVLQHLELQGAWLERGRIAADDTRLLDGLLGLAGHRCLASLFLAAGEELPRQRREDLLEAARGVIAAHALAATAGATAPGPRVLVVRVLAPLVEPALQLLKAVRRAWRPLLWNIAAAEPRGWNV